MGAPQSWPCRWAFLAGGALGAIITSAVWLAFRTTRLPWSGRSGPVASPAQRQHRPVTAPGVVGLQGSMPCGTPMTAAMHTGGAVVLPPTAPPAALGSIRVVRAGRRHTTAPVHPTTAGADAAGRGHGGASALDASSRRRALIPTAFVLAFGTAITALVLADGPRLSGWLLLGMLLLADGVVRLLSLGRSGWFMAAACAGVLTVAALSSATLSWSRGRDRAPERDAGIILTPIPTTRPVTRPTASPTAPPPPRPVASMPSPHLASSD